MSFVMSRIQWEVTALAMWFLSKCTTCHETAWTVTIVVGNFAS